MAERLSAGDVCSRSVVFAYPALSIADAARLMREHHVGSLVVVEETPAGRRVLGMLTDRDIVTGVVAKGVDPALLRVEDLMGDDLVSAREDDSVIDLLAVMRRKGVRRIPVVDGQGLLIGLAALDDLLEVIAEELTLVAQAIESGRKREPRARP